MQQPIYQTLYVALIEMMSITSESTGEETSKKIIASDLRNVVAGDPSPDGSGKIEIKRGIEVGHIFQLGTKYSDSMNANVIGEDGRAVNMNMGCYGIGVTRIIAASIEQNNDDRGIIFPQAIAPFELIIVPINYNKSSRVKALSRPALYGLCRSKY